MKRSDSPVDLARRTLMLGAAAALAGVNAPARPGPRELMVVGAHFARVYERANGEFSGMAVEIIRAIAGDLGQPVHFELYPWARAQSMVAQGQADILVGPYKSPERLASFSFSERPFYQDQMVFFSRSNAPFDWDGSYASLRNKRIVIINGWAYGDEFNAARNQLSVSVTNSVESALTMLAHGRVDLFASNVRNTEPVIPLLALDGKVMPVGRTISLQRGFFAFPKRPEYDILRARFDKAFNAYVDGGELRKLGKRLSVQVP